MGGVDIITEGALDGRKRGVFNLIIRGMHDDYRIWTPNYGSSLLTPRPALLVASLDKHE